MEVIPIIHVKGGKVVSAQRNPVCTVREALEKLKKYKMLYLVDVDGIESSQPDFELLANLAKRHIWYDGGARNIDDVMDAFVAGAERVTVRSSLFEGELSEIAGDVEDTYIGIEHRGNSGKLPDIDASMFSGVVLIDLARAGKRSGFNEELVRAAAEKWKNLYLAGGLRLEDVPALNKIGAAGALIGTDILRGRTDEGGDDSG
ncbi:MAG: hypothetical protein CVT47_03195 [Thermoplasmata archaeon HGW-Thermoplasmata-2]|nr:MAG: hypothetical protein CVT47_03195 [Thermoplasmata archaeon HGW-Thermoplasmata-2]